MGQKRNKWGQLENEGLRGGYAVGSMERTTVDGLRVVRIGDGGEMGWTERKEGLRDWGRRREREEDMGFFELEEQEEQQERRGEEARERVYAAAIFLSPFWFAGLVPSSLLFSPLKIVLFSLFYLEEP